MVVFIIGCVFSVLVAVLFFVGYKNHSEMLELLDKEAYPLPELTVIGISALLISTKFGFNPHKTGIKTKAMLSELYTPDYEKVSDLYILHLSALITYIIVVFPIGCFLGVIVGEPVLGILFGCLGLLFAFLINSDLKSRIDEMHEEIQYDFPNVLSDTALLVNAGATVRQAWEMVSVSDNRKIYREMQDAVLKMKNGYTEMDVYNEFSERCRLSEIRKFTSLLMQNITVGNPNLPAIIQEMAREAWEIKKHIATRRGSAAADKLMVPMFLIFGGILVIVIVPILTNMMGGF